MAHDAPRPLSDGAESLASALDRLADGALDADQRLALFRQLEHTPDGWRQCALALLETRAWEEAFRSPQQGKLSAEDCNPLSRVPAQRAAAPRSVPPRSAASWSSQETLRPKLPSGSGSAGAALRWCVLAASVLAAFGIGRWERSVDSVGPPPHWPGDQIVQQPPLDDPPVQHSPTVQHSAVASATTPPATAAALPRQQRVYRVVFSDPLSGREWEQSVVAEEREDLDYAGLAPTQPVVPPWLQAEWERQGRQVQQRRRLIAYPLEDGRQLVVPVDEVQISPVVMPAY